jgi:hypothetical protein
MGKGQKSNRETKKPKKVRLKNLSHNGHDRNGTAEAEFRHGRETEAVTPCAPYGDDSG